MADLIYPPIIGAARLTFAALGIHFDIVGAENIPAQGGAVLASNHLSYLDFTFCGFAARPRLVRFMAKEAIFRHWLAGPLMRGMHHISVDRDAGLGSFREALTAIRAGEIVGVFPEATISTTFSIKDLKSGAVRLAMSANAPLIPMVTFGGQRLLTKGRHRDFSRGKTVVMIIGEPLYPQRTDDAAEVTSELRRRLEALLAESVARYPNRPDDAWWLPHPTAPQE
ncbi:MAG: lysophospholipid acyltransferase family protein [Actinomycetes bacterium]